MYLAQGIYRPYAQPALRLPNVRQWLEAISFTDQDTPDLTGVAAAADGASYTTPSWTPPTSGIVAVCVANRIANPGNKPTLTGNGMTWTEVATLSDDPGAAHRLTWFLAACIASPATEAVTIDFAAQTQLSCNASFFSVTGVDISGGLAAAVVQAPFTSGTNTTGTITFAAAGHADNRAVCAWFHQANEGTNEDTTNGWTEIDDQAGTGPTRGFQTQWLATGVANNTSTWTTSSAYIGLGLELKATVAGGTVKVQRLLTLGVG